MTLTTLTNGLCDDVFVARAVARSRFSGLFMSRAPCLDHVLTLGPSHEIIQFQYYRALVFARFSRNSLTSLSLTPPSWFLPWQDVVGMSTRTRRHDWHTFVLAGEIEHTFGSGVHQRKNAPRSHSCLCRFWLAAQCVAGRACGQLKWTLSLSDLVRRRPNCSKIAVKVGNIEFRRYPAKNKCDALHQTNCTHSVELNTLVNIFGSSTRVCQRSAQTVTQKHNFATDEIPYVTKSLTSLGKVSSFKLMNGIFVKPLALLSTLPS